MHRDSSLLKTLNVVIAMCVVLVSTGCGEGSPATSDRAQAGSGPNASNSGANAASGRDTSVMANFGTDPNAFIYDQAVVPRGAGVEVVQQVQGESTKVILTVHGLLPDHVYGAHVHKMPCGAKGDDAGPHFQHQPDPVKPSVNPAYANPRNEVWLDLTTDAQGDGSSSSLVPWKFTPQASAGSVVIHAEKTQTTPGKAGTAGARVACVSEHF